MSRKGRQVLSLLEAIDKRLSVLRGESRRTAKLITRVHAQARKEGLLPC